VEDMVKLKIAELALSLISAIVNAAKAAIKFFCQVFKPKQAAEPEVCPC